MNKKLMRLFGEVQKEWRKRIKKEHPLYYRIPIIKKPIRNKRDWAFYTDLQSIFYEFGEAEVIYKEVGKCSSIFWPSESPWKLIREVFKYLLYHELYHPLYAPYSTSGTNNDLLNIHKAIANGFKESRGNLSSANICNKTHMITNCIQDIIIDNMLYVENKSNQYFQEDIIPLWDIVELQKMKEKKKNFYVFTRYMYGLLYGEWSMYPYFYDFVDNRIEYDLEMMLREITGENITLNWRRIQKEEKRNKSSDELSLVTFREQLDSCTEKLYNLFSSNHRYATIGIIAKYLEPYINSNENAFEGRIDIVSEFEENENTGIQKVLKNLTEELNDDEKRNFLDDIINSEKKSCDIIEYIAIHEFYKNNHPHIEIKANAMTGNRVQKGKKQYWQLKKTSIIDEGFFESYSLSKINQLQQKSGKPWLIEISKGLYRFNEYILTDREQVGIEYTQESIDVPDTLHLYVDSSGSMYGPKSEYGVNDGSRWDMLAHVVYGFIDTLDQASKIINKKTTINFYNFGEQQIQAPKISTSEFLSGNIDFLKVMFNPENGYGYENIDIITEVSTGKHVYMVVTDGQLTLDGRTDREAEKMKLLSRKEGISVILFEIGNKYSLGKAVADDPYIIYKSVYNKKNMFDEGIKVLLQYDV